MRANFHYLPATVLLLVSGAPAAAQLTLVDEGPIRLDLSGRGQFQFNSTSVEDEPTSTFEQRRVRLGAALVIDEWIEGSVEADFAMGELEVKDAYMNLAFAPQFQIQAGQFKKPFSRLELFSSSKIFPIERGVRIRGVDVQREHYELLDASGYLSREIGAQVHGELGPVGYAAGVFNGSGADSPDVNDAKSYAGRLTYRPLATLPFELGAGGSYVEVPDPLAPGGDETLDGVAFEADLLWGGFRHPGLNLMAEFMTGQNLELDDRMMGAQGILTWFEPTGWSRLEGVEPVVRVSWGDPETDVDHDSGLLVTPGVNVYFHGRNRFMLNWDLYRFGPEADFFEDGAGAHAIRAQMNLFF